MDNNELKQQIRDIIAEESPQISDNSLDYASSSLIQKIELIGIGHDLVLEQTIVGSLYSLVDMEEAQRIASRVVKIVSQQR